MPRCPARRPVSLHPVHGVYNRQTDLRAKIFIQVHQHIGKSRRFRKAHMIFRLRCSRNHPEQILRAAGHPQHCMGLQLCKINDDIRLIQPAGIVKRLRTDRVRKDGLPDRSVQIQPRPGLLNSLIAGISIGTLQNSRRKQPSRTVSDDHFGSLFAQHPAQSRNQLRMRRHCPAFLCSRYQVGLYRHLHARRHKIQPAERSQKLPHGGPDRFRFIILARDKGNPVLLLIQTHRYQILSFCISAGMLTC